MLTRIECLGQICAWTKLSNKGVRRPKGHTGLEFGCPALDFVELPRLKLCFTARLDHDGVQRLYSVDHGDLFITSEKNEMTEKMLSGIPHSLLLTNVRGETQVLVPVVPPQRPVGGAFAVVCVCVCHVRCARTHRPSGRCACVPLCHVSVLAHTASGLIHTTRGFIRPP